MIGNSQKAHNGPEGSIATKLCPGLFHHRRRRTLSRHLAGPRWMWCRLRCQIPEGTSWQAGLIPCASELTTRPGRDTLVGVADSTLFRYIYQDHQFQTTQHLTQLSPETWWKWPRMQSICQEFTVSPKTHWKLSCWFVVGVSWTRSMRRELNTTWCIELWQPLHLPARPDSCDSSASSYPNYNTVLTAKIWSS